MRLTIVGFSVVAERWHLRGSRIASLLPGLCGGGTFPASRRHSRQRQARRRDRRRAHQRRGEGWGKDAAGAVPSPGDTTLSRKWRARTAGGAYNQQKTPRDIAARHAIERRRFDGETMCSRVISAVYLRESFVEQVKFPHESLWDLDICDASEWARENCCYYISMMWCWRFTSF